ncbi:hypothetical protein PIB30_011352 [Stylosanthes scabra]|uniref:Uncharacterized protein n=1 Tax=Stylosanthes scabra TaxID=79078 RepID=A0ABU6X333_9FABA|nr:hypothetical protein [Stylosanthes scabra]
MESVAGCKILVNPFHPATDSELRETKLEESVAPCFHPAMDSVVPGEDERQAKMAEAEDGERDMRRRSKTSRCEWVD